MTQLIHLSVLLAALHGTGHPAAWSVSGLWRAYERSGIRVRKSVKIEGRVNTGIHRDDLVMVGS